MKRDHIIIILLYSSHPSMILKARRVKGSNSIPAGFTYIISFNPHDNATKYYYHYYHIIHFAEEETEAQRGSTSSPKTCSWYGKVSPWRSCFSYHITPLSIMPCREPRAQNRCKVKFLSKYHTHGNNYSIATYSKDELQVT